LSFSYFSAAFRFGNAGGKPMGESKVSAVKFLEKEIKTYLALSLFLSKKDIEEHVHVGDNKILINPTFYKERMKEAKKIVTDLRKSN
jgi:hypothetical protein